MKILYFLASMIMLYSSAMQFHTMLSTSSSLFFNGFFTLLGLFVSWYWWDRAFESSKSVQKSEER